MATQSSPNSISCRFRFISWLAGGLVGTIHSPATLARTSRCVRSTRALSIRRGHYELAARAGVYSLSVQPSMTSLRTKDHE
jgi:hypothetical protein